MTKGDLFNFIHQLPNNKWGVSFFWTCLFFCAVIVSFSAPIKGAYSVLKLLAAAIELLSLLSLLRLNQFKFINFQEGCGPQVIVGACVLYFALFSWLSYDYVKGITDYIACGYPDPVAYLTQAKMLVAGHLSASTPSLPGFFSLTYCLNHGGHFFGKYSPGWPALWSIGLKTGFPWIVNPFLTSLALFLVYLSARKLFDQLTATMAFVFASASPIIMWSARSYFSEPLAFLSATVFLYSSIRALADASHKWSLFAGISLGTLFLTRPYTALALCIPISCIWIIKSFRDPAHLLRAISLSMSALPLIALHCMYNSHLTGHWSTFPFSLYNIHDRLGFGLRAPDITTTPGYFGLRDIPFNTLRLTIDFALSGIPLGPLWIGGLLLKPTRKSIFLLFVPLCFIAFHSLYFYTSVRYLMPIMSIIAAGCALGFMNISTGFFKKENASGKALTAIVIISFFYVLTTTIPAFITESKEQLHNMDPFLTIKKERLNNAVVILRSDPKSFSLFYTQNAPAFNNPTLFVHDLGAQDTLLFSRYPSRLFYYYDYDSSVNRGHLSRIK